MDPQLFEVMLERDITARMRDGVLLRSDIYRPKSEGKFPVLMQRTPYNKANYTSNGAPFAIRAATRGYVVILQDVRGRFSSDGEWYPFRHEMEDGYDTVEWAAALPYSDGKVGMFGWSYLGSTQMYAALAQPPHLVSIFPVVTGSNYYEDWTYRGGVFQQFFNQSWTSFRLSPDTLNRRVQKNANALRWVRDLPLGDYPIFDTPPPAELAPYYFDWLSHPGYDDYWKELSIERRHEKVLVPAYHVAGWYDIFTGGSLNNYTGIKAHGGNEAARRGQRLLIGPWYHDFLSVREGKCGDVEFGPVAAVNEEDIMLRWFDHTVKGISNGIELEKPVRIFVMGENVWRDEDDWPLTRAQNTPFYLHSGGQANSLTGDGTLSTVAPQDEPADTYRYDPADPVLTRGGGACCDHDHLAPGAFDQRPNEMRADVLVYSTPVLEEEVEVTGPIKAELYISSSAVDTDFTAKLVDVWPNGFAQNLADGIQRARYRLSPERTEFMNPGEIYRLTIDLWVTSNLFRRGHKIRLEISSSNFPRFSRNLNTGELPLRAARMVEATNRVYHDREHPSAVVLPVIPR
jgi:hypothetical protein